MKFLTTKGIAAGIEEIFRNANNFIFVVCPYMKVDRAYIDRLHEAEQRNVKIDLIFGKEDMGDGEKEKLQNFSNMTVHFLENLHAKCYMNENTAIITSMNLYGYSEANNREMGIEIYKPENGELYANVLREMHSIRNAAEKYDICSQTPPANTFSEESRSFSTMKRLGYCIRCGNRIPFDPRRPLCDNCFRVWADFGNEDYPENFCHRCGKEIYFGQAISYAQPLCYNCWSNS